MIDLHIHSTASDGSFTPSEIIEHACALGLKAISITDHDTTDGVKEVIEKGIPSQLEFISGVEISAEPLPGFGNSGSLHILGYGFSIYDTGLNSMLETLKNSRTDRNPRIIEKLKGLGFDLSLDEVRGLCGPGQTGRPHIAMGMVAKGFVSSIEEAFDLYLGKGKPAYVDKYRLSCREVIKNIIKAGGVPVLAHPGLIKTTENTSINFLISQLMEMGLLGIEVFHTDHSLEQTDLYETIASKRGLIKTGGTDFHGSLKPEISMGKGRGTLHVDDELYTKLTMEVEKTQKSNSTVELLEKNLCHTFADQSLLYNALCHSSYVNEIQKPEEKDNQRLEYLGDAVLGLAIGHILMEKFPEMNEGDLSKFRSVLVSESGLAAMARSLDIGRFISLGKGERLSGGAEKNSILADTLEAIIAAIYLDQGFDTAYEIINFHFSEHIQKHAAHAETIDYKSMLQEIVQEMGNFTPCYKVIGEEGPDHDKTFQVLLNACDIKARGLGKSKKAAEQNAAENILTRLKKKLAALKASPASKKDKGMEWEEINPHP